MIAFTSKAIFELISRLSVHLKSCKLVEEAAKLFREGASNFPFIKKEPVDFERGINYKTEGVGLCISENLSENRLRKRMWITDETCADTRLKF